MNTDENRVRVAAAQFHVGTDKGQNLSSCLSWIKKAAECQPDLIVLPEFCNHLSWYDSKEHCYEVSVEMDGPFLSAIAEMARECSVHVVVNCTVRREGKQITGSSLLYSPSGDLLMENTKQIYIGHENDFLERATTEGRVINTPLGRVGLYACMDGVINETPRCLALNGAQLMLNSLNSFASDEGSLHIPVRAAENKVYVVAASKVGPLVPEDLLGVVSEAAAIPERFLYGAGESQIVAPDGTILAKASLDREEYIFADIDITAADDKRRPDGTDIFRSRRPELYKPIAQDPSEQPMPLMHGASAVQAAVLSLPEGADISCVLDAVQDAVKRGARLVGLPPLAGDCCDLEAAAASGERLLEALPPVCGDACITTSLVRRVEDGYQYCAVAVGSDGVLLSQGQVHPSERYSWSIPAERFETVELDFGRLALVTSDDSIYPETFRLLAIAGVEVVSIPLSPLESWELDTGLLERSAENRLNLVVAPDSSIFGYGFITELQTDFTVMTPWKEREFDGLLSQPIWHRASGDDVLIATIRPRNASLKVVSHNTDLLKSRPWNLASPICRI